MCIISLIGPCVKLELVNSKPVRGCGMVVVAVATSDFEFRPALRNGENKKNVPSKKIEVRNAHCQAENWITGWPYYQMGGRIEKRNLCRNKGTP